jgi:hypothetical protein
MVRMARVVQCLGLCCALILGADTGSEGKEAASEESPSSRGEGEGGGGGGEGGVEFWNQEMWWERHRMLTASEPYLQTVTGADTTTTTDATTTSSTDGSCRGVDGGAEADTAGAAGSGGTCAFPEMARFLDGMPVMYINLDSALSRRSYMERNYGCLDLTRIPAVLGSDPELESKYLAHSLREVPGLVEQLEGDPAVGEDEKRMQSKTSEKMFLGALGCFLSHAKAAYAMLSQGAEAVLILEDDMSPELIPYWLEPGIRSYRNVANVTAVQLAVQTSDVVWDHLFEVSKRGAPTMLVDHDNSGGVSWLASNGAYILTRAGAISIMKTLLEPRFLRFNLTGLSCINIDICLFPYLNHKAIAIPPLFAHLRDGDADGDEAGTRAPGPGPAAGAASTTRSSSIISSDMRVHQEKQLQMRWISRERSVDMAIDAYIRKPTSRLAYFV